MSRTASPGRQVGLCCLIPALLAVALVSAERQRPPSIIDDETLRRADERPSEWLTYGRTYDEQRHSPLLQIDADNVSRLGLVWAFETGTDRGLEATPLVVDDTIYTTGSWTIVYAIDGQTGREIWRWDPKVDREKYEAWACCDVVNRGVAFYKGRVYVGVLDGRLAALDARTGALSWEVLTVDQSLPYTITGAPRIVKGAVIIGNGGAEYGVRGYVSAYAAATGQLRWRFYTVPGDPSKPPESKAMQRALSTWRGDNWWQYGGGGTVWDSMAYDPALNLLYVGTGNGSPWNRHVRSPGGGDNLYLASILAINPDNGELIWYYQTTPGDHWDYTATQHIMLANLRIAGRERQVLMQAPKNGFFYVLDRATGELISARPYVPMNWATGIDAATGRPIEAPGAEYLDRGIQIRPGPLGGHNWQPMSFNPATGLVYLPAQENARYYQQPTEAFQYVLGEWNLALYAGRLPDEQRKLEWPYNGSLLAWDPVKGEPRWTVDYANHWNGGTLSTAGNLVFQGTAGGELVAYRATDGMKLWSTWAGTGIVAPPITYAIEGRQYVAVMAGWGGAFARRYRTKGRLLTFALDGRGTVEPRPALRPISSLELSASPEEIALGATLYHAHCARCHDGASVLPDLRYSPPSVFDLYPIILLKSTLVPRGMPRFESQLDERDVQALRAYVIAERNKLARGASP